VVICCCERSPPIPCHQWHQVCVVLDSCKGVTSIERKSITTQDSYAHLFVSGHSDFLGQIIAYIESPLDPDLNYESADDLYKQWLTLTSTPGVSQASKK
jgi:hypothetical protein